MRKKDEERDRTFSVILAYRIYRDASRVRVRPIDLSLINRTTPVCVCVCVRSLSTSLFHTSAVVNPLTTRRRQSAIVDSSHVTIIIHLGNYFANYLARLARGWVLSQAAATIIRGDARGRGAEGGARGSGGGCFRGTLTSISIQAPRELTCKSKFLATKAASVVASERANEGLGAEGERGERRRRGEEREDAAVRSSPVLLMLRDT